MAGESGIEVDVGITLNKLTKQLAAAEARFEKAAKRASSAFAKSGSDIGKSFDRVSKSAQSSANTFVKDMDRMRAKYDPLFAASQRYERELEDLNRAQKLGAINAEQHAAALQRLNAAFAQGASSASQTGSVVSGLGNRMASARGQIQNAAFQIGDFAVQVGSGQRASTALAQQLPQLLGGFGAIGAVMGAVVAIGVPLAAAFYNSVPAAKDFGDALEELEAALQAYQTAAENSILTNDQMVEAYGNGAEVLRGSLQILRDLAQATAETALGDAATSLVEDFNVISGSLDRLQTLQLQGAEGGRAWRRVISDLKEEYGLTVEQARLVNDAVSALGAASGPAQTADAARALNNILLDVYGTVSAMPEIFQEMAQATANVDIQAVQLKGTVESTQVSVSDLVAALGGAAGAISSAIGPADALLSRVQLLAQAAWDYAGALGAGAAQGGRGGDPTKQGGALSDYNNPRNRLIVNPGSGGASARSPRRSGGSGSGGGSSAPSPQARLVEQSVAEIAALERKTEAIGKTKAEIAGLNVQYKLMDMAAKNNIDLSAQVAGSNKTVGETIKAQADEVARLTAAYEVNAAGVAFIETSIDSMADSFADVLLEGESLRDGMKSILKQMARDILTSGIKDALSGIFSGGGSGGGGGFFGAFKKVLGFERGGYTGDGGKSQPAGVVHKGEYVFDKKATQRLGVANLERLRSGALPGFMTGGLVGGSTPSSRQSSAQNTMTTLRLIVPEGVTIEQVGKVAAGISLEMVQQNNKQIPGIVAESQGRG